MNQISARWPNWSVYYHVGKGNWFLWDSGLQVKIHSDEIRNLKEADKKFIEYALALGAENELLRKDNEMLRQQLQHERELRERDLRELKTELRLQISEELRRFDNR